MDHFAWYAGQLGNPPPDELALRVQFLALLQVLPKKYLLSLNLYKSIIYFWYLYQKVVLKILRAEKLTFWEISKKKGNLSERPVPAFGKMTPLARILESL